MENENYNLLLDKIEETNKKIEETNSRVNSVCQFNETLLNRKSHDTEPNSSSPERKAELRKKIFGGIRA